MELQYYSFIIESEAYCDLCKMFSSFVVHANPTLLTIYTLQVIPAENTDYVETCRGTSAPKTIGRKLEDNNL